MFLMIKSKRLRMATVNDRLSHRRCQGGPKRPCPPKFLENVVILCFQSRFSKQNSVIRLKSNIFSPKIFFCHFVTLMFEVCTVTMGFTKLPRFSSCFCLRIKSSLNLQAVKVVGRLLHVCLLVLTSGRLMLLRTAKHVFRNTRTVVSNMGWRPPKGS